MHLNNLFYDCSSLERFELIPLILNEKESEKDYFQTINIKDIS